MIGFTVEFYKKRGDSFTEEIGVIVDSILVGTTHGNYTGALTGYSYTQYVIEAQDGELHRIEPRLVIKILSKPEQP